MPSLPREPLVSVLMTAYNREKYIAQAIESVLASTFQDFELIVVDDASKDNTINIAKSFVAKDDRIKLYVNEVNVGDYPNRNRAASYACGKYIKFLDSDDLIYPYGLAAMVGAMEKFPEAGFGLSSASDVRSPYPICISPEQIYRENFNGFGHFDRAPGSAIIRRTAFEDIGGFSGERMIGDYELWFRMARKYKLVKMVRDLVWDRRHEGSESADQYAKNYPKLKRKVLLDALNHPDCPLPERERERLLTGARRNRLERFLNSIIDPMKSKLVALLTWWRSPKVNFSSRNYWENRYQNAGNSGAGSYGRLAGFKAEVLNKLFADNSIRDVIEFGCGDGNQLGMLKTDRYIGLDVSIAAIQKCQEKFKGDQSKSFFLYDHHAFVDHHGVFQCDCAISLDVLYHLVEEGVYQDYLKHLFGAAKKMVVIYAANVEVEAKTFHEKYRVFTNDIEKNISGWYLVEEIKNKYPATNYDDQEGSLANFYVYAPRR